MHFQTIFDTKKVKDTESPLVPMLVQVREKEWELAPAHLMSAPALAKAEESLEVLPPASDLGLEPWKD